VEGHAIMHDLSRARDSHLESFSLSSHGVAQDTTHETHLSVVGSVMVMNPTGRST
jgi:hypothetical protein